MNIRLNSLKAAGIYLTVSLLWILLSDHTASLLFTDPEKLIIVQNYKGIFFITVSALIIYLLIFRLLKEQNQMIDKLSHMKKKYSALFNNTNLIMILSDPDSGQIIEANQAAVEFYGFSKEELDHYNFFHLSENQELIELNFRHAKAESHYSYIDYHRTKYHEVINVEVYITPVQIEDQTFFHCLIINIEERKQLESEVNKFKKIVQQLPLAVVMTDQNGVIEFSNKKLYELTGYQPSEVIGKNPNVLKSGEHPPEFYRKLWTTIKSGKIWQGEILNRKKNGILYWEKIIISPYQNINGKITHFIAIKEDITETKSMKEQLIHQKNKAEQANQAKSDFLANMSHELRTPLNGILGFTQILKSQEKDQRKQEMLTLIETSGQNLLLIIRDLLNLSEIEAGKIQLNVIPVSLKQFLQKIQTHSEPFAASKQNIKWSIESNVNLPEKIYTDPLKLEQILINLISNAFKFTEEGNISLTVCSIDKQSNQDIIEFSITDTGIGIEENIKHIIFERFVQGENYLIKKYEGTGLGLSITKNLVELMDGQINVESTFGKGSTFTVRIPFYTGDLKQHQNNSIKKKESKNTGRKILIVEDDLINREFIKTLLASEIWLTVLEAIDGFEAIEKLEADPEIELVMMDLQMPGMNGFSGIKKIRSLGFDIPCIAFSGYTDEENIQKALKSGFNDFIKKPLNYQDIIGKIKKFILSAENHTFSDEKSNQE